MSETNATSADDEFSTFETAGDAEDDFGEFDDFTDFASGNVVDDNPEIVQEIDSESARKGDETGNGLEESGFSNVLGLADKENVNSGLSIGETVVDLDEAIASIAKVETQQILAVNPQRYACVHVREHEWNMCLVFCIIVIYVIPANELY